MTIYLLLDNGPIEWGTALISPAYRTKEEADKRVAVLKKQDTYRWQYLEVRSMRVKDENTRKNLQNRKG